MAYEKSGSSFDINQARDISRRIALEGSEERRVSGVPEDVEAAPGFIRFSANKWVAAPAATSVAAPAADSAAAPAPFTMTAPAAPVEEVLPPLDTEGQGVAQALETVFKWLLDNTPVNAVVAADGNGLILGAQGGLAPEEAEQMGARLVGMFEHIYKVGTDEAATTELNGSDFSYTSMTVNRSGVWISALQVSGTTGNSVYVGAIGTAGLSTKAFDAVAEKMKGFVVF
ncbi:hypothetical protein KAI87_01345 [Myxococcota bacterium]|nr:hypothetical protein [Myxococcota bacterium]